MNRVMIVCALCTLGLPALAQSGKDLPPPPPRESSVHFGPAEVTPVLGKRVIVRDIVGQDIEGDAVAAMPDRMELKVEDEPEPVFVKYKHIVSIRVVKPSIGERAADAALVAAGGAAAGAGAAATRIGERVGDAIGEKTAEAIDEGNLIERGIDLGFEVLERHVLGDDERTLDDEAPPEVGPSFGLGRPVAPPASTRREAFDHARAERGAFELGVPPEERAPAEERFELGVEAGEAAAAEQHFSVWFLGGLFAGILPVTCCAAVAVGLFLPARPPFDSGSRSKSFHEGFEEGYADETRFWRVTSVVFGGTLMVGLIAAGVGAAGAAYAFRSLSR